MAGRAVAGHAGEGVGGQDVVVVLVARPSVPGRHLGLGDAGHRRADDPGQLHGRVDVGGAQVEHRLEEADRLDVEVGEDRVVVAHVEEAEGPPEPPEQVQTAGR